MRKHRGVLTVVGIILAAILAYNLFVHATLFFNLSPMLMPSKEAMEKNFAKNKTEILLVTDYIDSLEYDSVRITNDTVVSAWGHKSGVGSEDIEIDDEKIIGLFTQLFQKGGYKIISAKKDFVEFQKWATRDKDCGIVYSFSGEKPNIEFLTELSPLSEQGWYYYVSDFDEYRRNNQAK